MRKKIHLKILFTCPPPPPTQPQLFLDQILQTSIYTQGHKLGQKKLKGNFHVLSTTELKLFYFIVLRNCNHL